MKPHGQICIKLLQTCLAVVVILFAGVSYAGLGLTKAIVGNLSQVPSGQQFTYRLSYSAASTTTDFHGVILEDVLPPGLSYISSQGTAHTASIAYTAATRTVRVVFIDPLPAGSTGQIDLNVMFNKGVTPDGTTVTNTATLSATGETSAVSPPVVIRATAADTVVASKTLVNPSVPLNQNITYTLAATASTDIGALSFTNLTLIDQLPAGSVFVSATAGGSYDSASNTVTWRVSDIVPGTANSRSGSITLLYPSAVFAVGNKVTNVVQVTGSPLGGAPTNHTASLVSTIVAPTTSSTFSKSVDGNYVYEGKAIAKTYTLAPKNTGNTPLSNVVVTDSVPAAVWVYEIYTGSYSGSPSGLGTGITVEYRTNLRDWTSVTNVPFSGASSQKITVSKLGLAPNEAISDLRWSFGDLPATYQISSLTFNGNILPTDRNGNAVIANQLIRNTAGLSYTDFNGVQTNKSATADITVKSPRPVVQLEKGFVAGGSTLAHGATGTFYVRLRNSSYAAQSMDNPVLADLLPSTLVYVDGSCTVARKPSGAPDPLFERIDNYGSTGRTLLRWSWTDATAYSLPTNDYIEIRFQAAQPIGTLYGSKNNDVTLAKWNNANIDSTSTSTRADTTDLDGDGNTSESIFYKTFSWTVPSEVSMDSQKWVKGTLDDDWTRYPDSSSVPGGKADYKLIVRNSGNVPIKDVVVDDVLPFIGDSGVIDLSQRASEWRPNLAGPVQAPTNVVVYYSTADNPTRTDFVSSGPVGSTPANWTTNAPGNITRVRALRFVFQNYALPPQTAINLTWPMRVPVGAPTGNEIAWNSFGFYGTRTDTSTVLLPSEPLKVGIKTVMDTNGAYGDRVWFDANKDGIQQPDELGVDGIRVELWKDSSEESVPDGIINTNVDVLVGWTITGDDQDGKGGYFLFPNLTQGNYYAKFEIPDPYIVTTNGVGTDATVDSDLDPVTRFTPIISLADKERNFSIDAGVWLPPYGVRLTTTASSAADGTVFWTNINQTVVYAYHLVNTGELALVDLKLSDSVLGSITNIAGPLAPGASVTVYAAYPSLLANVTNLASVLARPGDSSGREISGAPQAYSQDDATVQLYATLGGRIWEDLNADGVQDSGEPGKAGVSVTLYDTDNQVLTNVTSVADGSYVFRNLYPGRYRVGIERLGTSYLFSPTGKGTPTTDSDADTGTGQMAFTTLLSGASELSWDAGLYRLATIGDWVWNDADLDGIQDAGETGLENVAVRLLDGLGATVATTNTDTSGHYAFAGLVPGSYALQIVVPDGKVLTAKDKGGNDSNDSDANPATGLTATAALTSNESDLSWDFGLFTPAPSVAIIKTAGTAANGATFAATYGSDVVYTYVVNNTGNTWLAPVTVTDNVLGTVGTLASLAPGASGTLTATAHHVTSNTLNVAVVTAIPSDAYGRALAAAVTNQDDAYVTVQGVLGTSRVWQDDNRNGIQDLTESGISGVTVILLNAASEEVTRTVTGADGRYSFGETVAGSYRIAFIAPPHYYFTLANRGADDALDSDADPVSGRTGLIVVDGGTTQVGWDAGLYRLLPSIKLVKTAGNAADGEDFIVYGHGDVAYTYTVKNTGETHLSNIGVTDDKLGAIGTVAGPLAPGAQTTLTVTATNITAGVTNVGTVTANPVDESGADLAGVNDVSDSDSAAVVVLPRATLAGQVWVDAFRDGLRMSPELGLFGVTVILLDSNGTGVSTNRTVSDGTYLFTDILPGTYRVQVVLPSNTWHFTEQNVGVDDAIDSDVSPVSGQTDPIVLASGDHATGWDAGVYGGLPPGFCDTMTFGELFNAIILGDFQASGGDTEGRLAIGGSAWFTSGYSVGFASVGEPIAPASWEIDRLIVGNNLHDGSFGVNGNIVYGGVHDGPIRYSTNTLLRSVSPVTFSPDGNVPEDGSGMTFASIGESIRLASAMIGNMDNRGVTNVFRDAWTLLLQGNDPVLNVFNVNASDWNILRTENRIEAPSNSTVVVNIHGSPVSLATGTIVLVGVDSHHVLYNYVDALQFSSTSVEHPGSVLAPYATAQLSGGAINGFAFFGGSVTTMNGFEFHNFPFRGKICEEASELPRVALTVTAGTASDGAVFEIESGQDVSLAYRVTNTGNTWLTNVTVTDADLGVIGTLSYPLAPGESALLSKVAQALVTDWTFSATVTGTPTDAMGEPSTLFSSVSATDIAAVRMVAAGASGGSGGSTPSNDNTVRADLAVTSVNFITRPTLTGDVFSVSVTIDNHGEIGTDAGKLSIYLSAPSAVAPGTVAAATVDAGYLGAGESKFFVFNNLVAGNIPGTHHLRAYIDSLNTVNEWSDGDNQLTEIYALNAIYLNLWMVPEGVQLSWNSFWGQNYTLMQCTNLAQNFTAVMTHVVATPPTNSVLIANPPGLSFFKLMVEE